MLQSEVVFLLVQIWYTVQYNLWSPYARVSFLTVEVRVMRKRLPGDENLHPRVVWESLNYPYCTKKPWQSLVEVLYFQVWVLQQRCWPVCRVSSKAEPSSKGDFCALLLQFETLVLSERLVWLGLVTVAPASCKIHLLPAKYLLFKWHLKFE